MPAPCPEPPLLEENLARWIESAQWQPWVDVPQGATPMPLGLDACVDWIKGWRHGRLV